jgi:hypothetical protein
VEALRRTKQPSALRLYRDAARLLARGMSNKTVAELMGVSLQQINKIAADPYTLEWIAKVRADGLGLAAEGLKRGAAIGYDVLEELAVSAESEEVKLKAAIALVQQDGLTGKPTERQELKGTFQKVDVAAIANALRDPGVRAFLEQHPDLRAQVQKALPPAPSNVATAAPEPASTHDVP